MDNKTHRSMRTGIGLLILSSLTLPALAQAQTGPGYAGAGAYPPGQYGQSGRQVPPVPGPYNAGSGQDPGGYGMRGPGMMGGPGSMTGPRGGPGMMGGPQGGPGQIGSPGRMAGPQGGPGQMGGPGRMWGPQGGPGQMGGPGRMGGPQGGPGMMGGPGRMAGPQGGQGMMGGRGGMSRDSSGPEGGPAMAMMDAVARLDLTPEQRTKLHELRTDLTHRQQELLEKISAAASKLQEITKEQVRASRGLSDLRGHLMHANLDAANRAEEMLTDEQRQTLMSAGAHVMTPEQGR